MHDVNNEFDEPDCLSEALFKNQITVQDQLRGIVAKGWTGASFQTDPEKKVELDWTDPQEACKQHHTPGPNLEPAGQAKDRKDQKLLKTIHGQETTKSQARWKSVIDGLCYSWGQRA